MKEYNILAINPGSTSTKIALFQNDREVFHRTIGHDPDQMKQFKTVQDQLLFRKETVKQAVEETGWKLKDMDVFVGRGGGTYPIVGGTYLVTDLWMDHASKGLPGHHPAQLASQICKLFKDKYGGEAFVVNPPDVDEFDEIARITGLVDMYRECHSHALNQKEVSYRFCKSKNIEYNKSKLIVCHLGGGISVTAHHNGRMIESSDIIGGEGPMTPTRAGALPTIKLVKLCYSGRYTKDELINRLMRHGGLMDHCGTDDVRVVLKRIDHGDKYAKLILNSMIYQIAKNVGSCACALEGKIDGIILTGGMAHSDYIVKALIKKIDWLAPVTTMPGEFEMEALAAGVMRVVLGKEKALIYSGMPVWNGLASGDVN
jgi:butyrate kinase